jgi:hypothetical protein
MVWNPELRPAGRAQLQAFFVPETSRRDGLAIRDPSSRGVTAISERLQNKAQDQMFVEGTSTMSDHITPFAMTIERIVQIYGIPRTSLYQTASEGRIDCIKFGRRTMILRSRLLVI